MANAPTCSRSAERALKPGDRFANARGLPGDVVIPAGDFVMGSPETGRDSPRHKVTISRPFAVAKFDVTFADWDACVSAAGARLSADH